MWKKHKSSVNKATKRSCEPSGIRNQKTLQLLKTICEALILFFSQVQFQLVCGDCGFTKQFLVTKENQQRKSCGKQIAISEETLTSHATAAGNSNRWPTSLGSFHTSA